LDPDTAAGVGVLSHDAAVHNDAGITATAWSAEAGRALQEQAAADRQKMVDDLVAAGEVDPAEAELVVDRAISVLAHHAQTKRAPQLVQENRADRRRCEGGRRSRRRLR
jgi:hypothetical protein